MKETGLVTFLRGSFGTILIILCLLLNFDSAAIGAERTLRLGHATDSSAAFHKALLQYAENIAKRTNNRLKIIVYPASQLGGDREMFESVQIGNQDMIYSSSSPATSFVPEAAMWEFPYLIRDEAHWKKLIQGEIGAKFRNIFEKYGYKLNSFIWQGYRQAVTTRKCGKLEDFKGVKFRIMESPIQRTTWSTVGAVPVPTPYSEAYMALKLGTVEGMENPLSLLVAMKFYEVTKYLVMTSHSHQTSIIVMNKKVFDSLDSDLQKVITDESLKAEEYISTANENENADAIKFLTTKGKGNLELINPDLKPFFQRSEIILTEMEKKLKPEVVELIKGAKAIQ